MRQVAVQPARQGGGIGAGLVGFAEAWARERGFRKIVAHARGTAVDFYRRLNYTVEGEPFLECTIPHQLVSKTL
jgi:GNAT superfamily N-acetyltransferase